MGGDRIRAAVCVHAAEIGGAGRAAGRAGGYLSVADRGSPAAATAVRRRRRRRAARERKQKIEEADINK